MRKTVSTLSLCSLMLVSSGVIAATPDVIAYYPNYSGYFNNNVVSDSITTAGHAIPEAAYPMPGISKTYPAFNRVIDPPDNSIDQTNASKNKDLLSKLNVITTFVYSFLGVDNSGSIKFLDSWADLGANDVKFCAAHLKICVKPASETYYNYGNFDAFNAVQAPNQHPLDKYIAIGGWQGTNFSNTLTTDAQIKTFADSVQDLVGYYKNVSGIDLDVESNSANYKKSINFEQYVEQYLPKVITALKSVKTADGQPLQISLTIQADPKIFAQSGKYFNVILSNPDLMQSISHVNLMTYDFHGAFDYDPAKKSGVTGFSSNLYILKNDPRGESSFSVNQAVTALKSVLPASEYTKINIGIPAYARAGLTNVPATNGGLFQPFDSSSQIIPGDLDDTRCLTTLGSLTECSGTFSYRYVLQMLNTGEGSLVAADWQDPNHNNAYIGSTAYGASWAPKLQADPINGVAAEPYATNYPKDLKGVYLSYVSAKDAASYGQYAKQQGLGGVAIWTVMGDVDPSSPQSLMSNFVYAYEGLKAPAN